MRYKEQHLENDKMRLKHFRLIFRFLFYFENHRLPSFDSYFYDMTIHFALNYGAQDFDLKKATYSVNILKINK